MTKLQGKTDMIYQNLLQEKPCLPTQLVSKSI